MPHYRYVGPNDHYLDGGDTKLEPGDEVELDEATVESFPDYFERLDAVAERTATSTSDDVDETDSEPEDVQEESATEDVDEDSADGGAESDSDDVDETANDGEEIADPPLDPTQFSVDDLKTELNAGDFSDAELDALEAAERSDDDPRTTALDAIEAAR